MISLAIGIDFGTTKSHLAYIPRNAEIRALPKIATYERALRLTPTRDDIPDFRMYPGNIQPVPTVVSVKRSIAQVCNKMHLSIRCGYRALNQHEEDFDNYLIITRIKEYMGEDKIRVNQDLTAEFEPEGLAARFLYELKRGAIEIRDYQKDTLGVTITVPAKSTLPQRLATRFAAVVAGFEGEIYVLEEPISAFLYHRHVEPARFKAPRNPKFALVFDFGGGTCDVAIVQYQDGRLPCIVGRAMGKFGGEDVDQMILENFWARDSGSHADRLPYTAEEIRSDPMINRSLLLRHARLAKELLSSVKEEEQLSIRDYHPREVGTRRLPLIRRAQLRAMLETRNITKTVAGQERTDSIRGHILTLLCRVLQESKIKRNQIDKLIFAGGSSQLVGVRDWVQEFFQTRDGPHEPNTKLGEKDIIFSDLETSIAGGAAIHQFYRHSHDESLRQVVAPTLATKIYLVHYRNPANTERQEIVLGESAQLLPISRLTYWQAQVIFPLKRIESRPIHIEIRQGEEDSESITLGETDFAENYDAWAILVKYLIDEYGVVDRISLVPLNKFLFWQWKRQKTLHPIGPEVRIKLERFELTNRSRIDEMRKKYLPEI